MKHYQRVLNIFLALVTLMIVAPSMPAKAESTEAVIKVQMEAVKALLTSSGITYFTKNGAGCSHDSGLECNSSNNYNCHIKNMIPNAPKPLYTGAQVYAVDNKYAYTCTGYAKWLFYNLFDQLPYDDKTVWVGIAEARAGDYVKTKAHAGIFYTWANAAHTEFYMYDGNHSDFKIHYCDLPFKTSDVLEVKRSQNNVRDITPTGYLDVNGYLDGKNSGGTGNYGTFDVYIKNSLAVDDANDYYARHEKGTAYRIEDIKAKPGYEYLGIKEGVTSGTIPSGGTASVRLSFATQGNLFVQGNLDGTTDSSVADYGTFDVYINGTLDEDGCTSYNKRWPKGTTYEVKNITVASGKSYTGYTGSLTGTITSATESKVVLSYTTDGTATTEWQTGATLPGNLAPEMLDIEYKHTYISEGRTSPGDGWVLEKEGPVQYENDGAAYESDNEKATSVTRALVGYYYFHYCNGGDRVNYYWKADLPTKHTISLSEASHFSAQEKGTDGDGSGRKTYWLTHLDGPYAGGTAQCGTNGSKYYYRGYVYQEKKAYRINTYKKEMDWTATFDETASSYRVRWRLKDGLQTEYRGLQLNFVVDGVDCATLDGVAGVDVYIDGEKKAENVTHFKGSFPAGFAYEVRLNHVADNKVYRGVEGGELIGTVEQEDKTLTLYFETGVQAGEEWKEITPDMLPYVDESAEIEYKHIYIQEGRTSPGDGWVLEKEGAVQYENDGAAFESDNEKATSATLALVGYYYFHYCNGGDRANYYWKEDLPTKHTIPLSEVSHFSVQEKGIDGDGSGRKIYWLTHLDGPFAGGIAQCGTNGSRYYYRGGVYQKKKAYQINTYKKETDWTAEFDPDANFVSYRIRLKQYPVTFDANGGAFGVESLVKYSTVDLTLPEEKPTREPYVFTGWNTEANGSGTMYQPGQAYTADQAVTLYAQWKEMDSLVLPSSLTMIDEEAFSGISAAIVHVPNNCTEIRSKAFQNCANLQRIYISATTTTIALDAFDGCGNLTIYAPAGSTAIKVAKYNDIPYVEVE